jgi:hypothetical protein
VLDSEQRHQRQIHHTASLTGAALPPSIDFGSMMLNEYRQPVRRGQPS